MHVSNGYFQTHVYYFQRLASSRPIYVLVHYIFTTLLYIFLPACFSTTNVTMSHRSKAMQVALESSSSDDDDEFIMATTLMAHHHYQTQANVSHWGGSIPGHIVINRERAEQQNGLMRDYFSDNPTYGPVVFRRRYATIFSLDFFFVLATIFAPYFNCILLYL